MRMPCLLLVLTLLASISGATVLSMGPTDFVSNDPELNYKDAWLLTVSMDGSTQSVVGTFPGDQITGDGKSAEYPLTIEFRNDKQTCEYSIYQTQDLILHLNSDRRTFSYFTDPFGAKADKFFEECSDPAITPNTYYATMKGYSSYREVTCYTKSTLATVGNLPTKKLVFDSSIILTTQGKQADTTINNVDARSANLYDSLGKSIGHASWVGSLSTGESCPSSSDSGIIAAFYNGQWRTISEDKYDDYRTQYTTGFIGCLDRYLSYGSESPETCVQKFNVIADSSVAQKNFYSNIGSSYVSGSTVYLNLEKAVQYPMVTLRVLADWLGVKLSAGDPKILGITSEPFQTTGAMKVEIQNIGSDPGTFDVSAVCSSGFTVQSGEITLTPLATGTVNMLVSGSCAQSAAVSCTVTAKDREKPTNYDTMHTTLSCNPIIQCRASEETRCNGNLLEMCNSAGSGFVLLKECKYNCEVLQGIPQCTSPWIDCGDGVCSPGEELTCPEDCAKYCTGFIDWITGKITGRCAPRLVGPSFLRFLGFNQDMLYGFLIFVVVLVSIVGIYMAMQARGTAKMFKRVGGITHFRYPNRRRR